MKTCDKMQNETSQKKCITNFVNTSRKKDVTTQRKKQNIKEAYVANTYNTRVDNHARKSAPAGFASPEQTWPTATAGFLGNRNCRSNFLNKKNRKF